jgi:hypothetical protein
MELSSKGIKRLEEMCYHQDEFAVVDNGVTRLRNVDDGAISTVPLIRNAESMEKDPLDAIFILLYIW